MSHIDYSDNPNLFQLITNQGGKRASSNELRRFVWTHVVWSLILDTNRNYFTTKEYHNKRNKVCKDYNISPSKVGGGIMSLLNKGILYRDKDVYSVHPKLLLYVRRKINLEYGTVFKEINSNK
ncbi:MAG: hypothetical protein AB7V56_04590 [Candidatus Nitrosocosmicus sp.]|jgi:hypothetical protein|uniref:hypothetical protein n=1 Tax=Candidatus Nitrosocosmicus agrestis TaxID=2563600 RepID=UPI00122DED6A|nr:hypothetical protein [Candidatus Nitrosocosmicus sp. SS]KAA2282123.1 hypothetical protein F1Z66_06715 [Candidatus Nitrosocosmicus sp. SS]KAF0870032.1 hypothetical protein E5N71_02095 [Candidatus Nitrosocosmicus sp. SS]MDR4492277.1 hypothetical protein [Candidatus Nitrosocosmicus sp.]